MTVYLNGKYVDRGDAVVSVDDRGFVFGDGVYEVTRSRDGVLLEVDRHVRRLERSLAGLDLAYSPAELPAISLRLLRDNGLARGEATVYWQVTRGAASPRTHQFPPAGTPVTIYASASPFAPLHEKRGTGVGTIVIPDQRWARCDLKTVNLLPNVLAKQKAVAAGMHEAILQRDGVVMEARSSISISTTSWWQWQRTAKARTSRSAALHRRLRHAWLVRQLVGTTTRPQMVSGF